MALRTLRAWRLLPYLSSPRLLLEARNICTPVQMSCWKCQRSITPPENSFLFFCPCDEKVVLPPPAAVNFFQVFGHSPSFSINLTKLKQKYVELQRMLHPDKHGNKSHMEKEYALLQSSLVNKAYATLSLSYERGVYLLETLGIPLSEEENSDIEDQFLEEVMDINETLVNLSETEHEIFDSLKKKTEDYLQQSTEALHENFDKGNYSQAKEILNRMKYYINIQQKMRYLHSD